MRIMYSIRFEKIQIEIVCACVRVCVYDDAKAKPCCNFPETSTVVIFTSKQSMWRFICTYIYTCTIARSRLKIDTHTNANAAPKLYGRWIRAENAHAHTCYGYCISLYNWNRFLTHRHLYARTAKMKMWYLNYTKQTCSIFSSISRCLFSLSFHLFVWILFLQHIAQKRPFAHVKCLYILIRRTHIVIHSHVHMRAYVYVWWRVVIVYLPGIDVRMYAYACN